VCVYFSRFYRKLYIAYAAQTEVFHRNFPVVDSTKFPNTSISSQFFPMIMDKVVQVQAACFFLAFDHKLNPARELSLALQQCIYRE
jgi:hypothetical protein